MKINSRKIFLYVLALPVIIALSGAPVFAAPKPPPPPCTSYTYTAWGDCKPNGTQTRNVDTKTPSDCSINDPYSVVPVTEQSCTYVPPCATTAQISPASQTVPETTNGSPTVVQLNGQPSKDTNTYYWEQTGGPAVTLLYPTDAKPTFSAPSVGPAGAALTFKLTVTGCNPTQTSIATTTINVTDVKTNQPPVASATVSPATIIEGTVVTLDGTGSSDPDGDTLTYLWMQVGGSPTVVLTATDGSGAIVTFTAPIEYPSGATLTFKLTVSDGALSASTEKEVNVTWFNYPPVVNINCPLDPVNEGDAVNLMGSGSTDDDGDGIFSYEWSQLNGPPNVDLTGISSNADISFNAPSLGYQQDGKISFKLTVTDNGSLSTSAECSIQILDFTPPVISEAKDITAEATGPAGAAVEFSLTATDAVDGNVDVTCIPASGSIFKLDETRNVSCSAKDKAGNTASASFNVTVVDTTPPTLTLPANKTVEATGPSGAAFTFTATANDIVDGPVTPVCTPASGSTFPLDITTTVNCTATDAHGNSSTGSFTVKVVDTTPPALTLPSPIGPIEGDTLGGAIVNYSASANDIVDGSVAVSCDKASGSVFPLGTTTVTCSATDAHGNSSTGSFTVKVVDTTPPVITFEGSITDGSSFNFGDVPAAPTCTALDIVWGAVSCNVSGYSTAVGTHILTATATDGSGNKATVTRSYTVIPWTLKGFYQPVDMGGVWNTVKNGSTVPLKFEVFKGATELTDVSVVMSVKYLLVACTGGTEDAIEEIVTTTGGTVLRYDTTGGQFIDNWKTPSTAGKCYRVTMTTLDGSTLAAYFKLK